MRVCVLGAGGPAGVNACKALSAHEVVAVDQAKDHLVWCAPYAAETHWLPDVTPELVNEIGADVVIPQPDSLTLWLADHQDQIEARTFLPDRRTIALCQDKFEAGLAWRRAGLREDRVMLVEPGFNGGWDFPEPPFWLRARHGAGAKAAILARSKAEARAWRTFWNLRNTRLDFIAEGYLPGRDYAWSGIYYHGELVTSFARERLEYLYPGLTPEGLTGTPTIAEIVHDSEVNQMAAFAVEAVDEKPHGVYSVDLREDSGGVPRPTEINAGRGFTTFGLWATQADENLMEFVVDGAFGSLRGPWDWRRHNCLPEGLRLYRHIDCGSFVYMPVLA